MEPYWTFEHRLQQFYATPATGHDWKKRARAQLRRRSSIKARLQTLRKPAVPRNLGLYRNTPVAVYSKLHSKIRLCQAAQTNEVLREILKLIRSNNRGCVTICLELSFVNTLLHLLENESDQEALTLSCKILNCLAKGTLAVCKTLCKERKLDIILHCIQQHQGTSQVHLIRLLGYIAELSIELRERVIAQGFLEQLEGLFASGNEQTKQAIAETLCALLVPPKDLKVVSVAIPFVSKFFQFPELLDQSILLVLQLVEVVKVREFLFKQLFENETLYLILNSLKTGVHTSLYILKLVGSICTEQTVQALLAVGVPDILAEMWPAFDLSCKIEAVWVLGNIAESAGSLLDAAFLHSSMNILAAAFNEIIHHPTVSYTLSALCTHTSPLLRVNLCCLLPEIAEALHIINEAEPLFYLLKTCSLLADTGNLDVHSALSTSGCISAIERLAFFENPCISAVAEAVLAVLETSPRSPVALLQVPTHFSV